MGGCSPRQKSLPRGLQPNGGTEHDAQAPQAHAKRESTRTGILLQVLRNDHPEPWTLRGDRTQPDRRHDPAAIVGVALEGACANMGVVIARRRGTSMPPRAARAPRRRSDFISHMTRLATDRTRPGVDRSRHRRSAITATPRASRSKLSPERCARVSQRGTLAADRARWHATHGETHAMSTLCVRSRHAPRRAVPPRHPAWTRCSPVHGERKLTPNALRGALRDLPSRRVSAEHDGDAYTDRACPGCCRRSENNCAPSARGRNLAQERLAESRLPRTATRSVCLSAAMRAGPPHAADPRRRAGGPAARADRGGVRAGESADPRDTRKGPHGREAAQR